MTTPGNCLNCIRRTLLVNFGLGQVGRSADLKAWMVVNLDDVIRPSDELIIWGRRVSRKTEERT